MEPDDLLCSRSGRPIPGFYLFETRRLDGSREDCSQGGFMWQVGSYPWRGGSPRVVSP